MAAKGVWRKYRDPSWYQIVWLYVMVVIFFAVPAPTSLRLTVGIAFALVVTALAVIKLLRKPADDSSIDSR